MKIVILDAHTTNPGDLSWEAFERLGECTVHDRTAPEDVLARTRDAEAVIVNKVLLTAEVIAQLPRLRYIGLLSTGVNVVDLAAAKARGIPVCNVPAYGTMSVAQLVFAFILAFTHEVQRHSDSVHAGKWAASPDFCYWETPLVELDGLTLGLVGYGQIGQAVAKIGRAFGMRILVHTRSAQLREKREELRDEHHDGTTVPKNQLFSLNSSLLTEEEFVPLDELLHRSDFISLHCPLTEATNKLINADRLALMKPSAILINTGRGGLLDDTAVADALNSGRLAGAALDVLTEEPPRTPQHQPLLSAKNCKITPHLAWATRAARSRLVAVAAKNLADFLAGSPSNNAASVASI